jgi:hypothetical protein
LRHRGFSIRAGPDWLHEIKFDGYRMHARLDRGTVKLLTRTGLDPARSYLFDAAVVPGFVSDPLAEPPRAKKQLGLPYTSDLAAPCKGQREHRGGPP